MKLSRMSRRETIEEYIVRSALVAGVVGISQTNLLARWQEATREAMTATRPEVLGPFFKRGAPNVRVLRQPWQTSARRPGREPESPASARSALR